MERFDVIVVGAGAAGLHCAALAGQKGLRVLLLDNGKKIGRKILMSGGGRCNFTNLDIQPSAYLSQNAHFCKSALARFSQYDFIDLVNRYRIKWHEKTLGQLFCDGSAQQIVDLLQQECVKGNVTLRLRTEITAITQEARSGFILQLNGVAVCAEKLVVASGGLSMPGLGATPFGYKLAEQFAINVQPTRAGLVPFTLQAPLLENLKSLSGISVDILAQSESGQQFKEAMLFTHRGLSGPALLQLSSYWHPGERLQVNLLPDRDIQTLLIAARNTHPNSSLKNSLAKWLPKRLTELLVAIEIIPDVSLKQLDSKQTAELIEQLQTWTIQPNGTEGYRTAEVTLGGVDTHALSSKTMEVKQVAGLYFIGEVVDVTGWLGGYNFQWAWSSAAACAQAL